MKTRLTVLLLGSAVAYVTYGGWAVASNTNEATTVATIEKLGGEITVDDSRPGRPIIKLDFGGTHITDGDLEYLRGLTQLRSLCLISTKITGTGQASLA